MSVYECFRTQGTVHGTNIRKEHKNILRTEDLEKIYPDISSNSSEVQSWFVTHKTLSDICGCYESDIVPERKSQFINRMFSKDETLFNHRFAVVPQIKKIDDEIMKSSFCSIIIDPKHKQSILEELDSININERFLFPELEYTVNYVKEKYWKPHKG